MGGIFSTKRETKAFTAIQRMSDDDSIILSSQIAVMHYILEGAGKTSTSISDKSLPNYLIEYSQRALPRRCEQAYNYANSGHYAYGLPTAGEATVQGVNLSTAVKAYLDATSGHTVTMVYAFIGDANYQHFMWKKLEDDYGYNPTTNELEALSITEGFPCYLQTGKLVFGSATVQSTESGSVMEQYGYSTESGECTARSQNLGAASVSPDVDTDVTDAYAEFSYQYIEVIPDVTDPPDAVVNTLSTTSIDGYAEKDSSVQILVNTVPTTTVTADANGYFTYTFGTALTAGDVVKTIVVDAAANTSAGVDKTVPYTNGSPATVGTDKTITEIVHTESFSFDFLDYIPSAVATLPSAPDEPPITIVGSDAFVQEYDYIHACYTYVVGAVTHIAYLTYEHGSGTISALDDLFEMSVATGKFYPRLYSRLNSQSLPTTLSTSSSEYKSSKKLAKLMGIDWAEWSATLHSSVAESTPIGDVRQMFLTIAAPMNTTDPVIIEYQYRYWQKMYDDLTTSVTTGALAGTGARIGKVLEIKDAKYSNYVGFNAVNVTTVTGTIGTVGTYNSEYVNAKRAYTDANYAANTGRGALSAGLLTLLPAYHVYRYQDTLTTYKEVKVFGAVSTHSFEGFFTSSAGTDDNLVIPIDKTVVVYLSSNEKEILFGKCFYLVINLTKVIKTAWFARSAFKVVLVVVAIVLAFFGQAPLSVKILAFVVAVTVSVAVSVIITYLIKKGIITGKLASALAVVAFVLSALKGVANVNLLNLTAMQLLTFTSFAFDITAKAYTYEYQQIQKEASSFSLEVQEKQAALAKAKELLGDPPIPLELELLVSNSRSKVFITLGESPDDFMAKGSMNVIETLQGFVSNYVEIMMQPPSLQQLLNQSQRGDSDGRIEI